MALKQQKETPPPADSELAQLAESQTRIAVLTEGLKSQRGLLEAGGYFEPGEEVNWEDLAKEVALKKTLKGKPVADIDGFGEKLARVESIAKDVKGAVAENTGGIGGATFGQIFRGMMSNPGKFFSALMNGVIALFKGKSFAEAFKPLIEMVAPQTASDVGNDLKNRLTAHKDKNGLNDEQIDHIVYETQRKALGTAGIEIPEDAMPATPPEDKQATYNTVKAAAKVQIDKGLGASLAQMDMVHKFTADEQTVLSDTLATALSDVATKNGAAKDLKDPEQISEFIQKRLHDKVAELGLSKLGDSEQTAVSYLIASKTTLTYLDSRPGKPGLADAQKSFEEPTKDSMRVLAEPKVRSTLSELYTKEKNTIDSTITAATGENITEAQRQLIITDLSKSVTQLVVDGEKDPAVIQAKIAETLKGIESDKKDGLGSKLGSIADELAGSLTKMAAPLITGVPDPDAGKKGLKETVAETLKERVGVVFKEFGPKLAAIGVKDAAVADIQKSLEAALVKTITENPKFSTMNKDERAVAYSEAIQMELGKNMGTKQMPPTLQKHFSNLIGKSIAGGISGNINPDPKALEALVQGQVAEQIKGIQFPDKKGGTMGLATYIATMYAETTAAVQKDRWVINPLKWGSAGVKTPEEAKPIGDKAADIIADAVAKAVADPNMEYKGKKLANMTPDELSDAIVFKVKEAVVANGDALKEAGFQGEISDATALVSGLLKPEIQNNYALLHPAVSFIADAEKIAATGVKPGEVKVVVGKVEDHKAGTPVAPKTVASASVPAQTPLGV